MPAALADRPEPYDDLEPVLRAFAMLSTARPVHAGPGGVVHGAIPLSEIRAWCALAPVDDVEAFLQLIRAMDDEWLERVADRRRRLAEPGSAQPWTSP